MQAQRRLTRPDFRLRSAPVTVTWAEPKRDDVAAANDKV